MEKPTINEVAGAGGDGPLDADRLAGLKAAAAEWNNRAAEFWARRLDNEQTRFCVWNGQSTDGRMWADNLNGEVPAPFDGASDQRIAWADALIAEQAEMLMVAMMRAQPRCEGRGKGDGQRAQKATALLRWMIDRLGREWPRQWLALLNYALQDTPGVALMGVEWVTKRTLKLEMVDVAGLAEMYLKTVGSGQGAGGSGQGAGGSGQGAVEQAAMVDFAAALVDEERGEDELAAMVMEFFPDLKPARAARIVRDIRRNGEAEFPVPVVEYEGPRITARRYGDDFIVPDNARDFESATPWFATEWLTETELRARAAAEEWDAGFVEDVLAQEGVACLRQWADNTVAGGIYREEIAPACNTGRYQVLWCYYLALNEDDVQARYVSVIHPGSERTAFGRRMLRDAHGNWPGVLFQREVVDGFILNSRGVPELVGPSQGMVKGLLDSSADAAQMWSLPPILSFGVESHGNIYVEPLKILKGKRDARFEAMSPPAAPPQAEMVIKRLEALRDWMMGRASEADQDNGQRASVAREARVVWFLSHVRDVMRMMLALARQYASDELLARVTDRAGDGVIREAGDIRGEFDVRLVFDPADLDFANLQQRLQTVRESVLAIDKAGTVDTTPLAQAAFRSVFPYMADDVLRDVKQAEGDELLEEARNLALIRSGVMPQLDTEGNWNYRLRRQWYDQMAQANPQVFADMGPDKQEILKQWLEGLEQQATQFGENVEIGRTGIVPPEQAGERESA
jgi:hypothetical protein